MDIKTTNGIDKIWNEVKKLNNELNIYPYSKSYLEKNQKEEDFFLKRISSFLQEKDFYKNPNADAVYQHWLHTIANIFHSNKNALTFINSKATYKIQNQNNMIGFFEGHSPSFNEQSITFFKSLAQKLYTEETASGINAGLKLNQKHIGKNSKINETYTVEPWLLVVAINWLTYTTQAPNHLHKTDNNLNPKQLTAIKCYKQFFEFLLTHTEKLETETARKILKIPTYTVDERINFVLSKNFDLSEKSLWYKTRTFLSRPELFLKISEHLTLNQLETILMASKPDTYNVFKFKEKLKTIIADKEKIALEKTITEHNEIVIKKPNVLIKL